VSGMDTIARIEATIDALQRDVVRLRGELSSAESELRDHQTALRVLEQYAESPTRPPTVAPDQVRMLPDVSSLTLADAASEILRFFGGRAASADLRRALIDSGKLPPSKDSYGYLLKVMRDKPDRFVRIEQGIWGLPEGAS
jgi:hypothetical protein